MPFTFVTLNPISPLGAGALVQNPYYGTSFKPIRLDTHPWVDAYWRGASGDRPRLSFLTKHMYLHGQKSFDPSSSSSSSSSDRSDDSADDGEEGEEISEDGTETPRGHGMQQRYVAPYETATVDNDGLMALSLMYRFALQSNWENDVRLFSQPAPVQAPFALEVWLGPATMLRSLTRPPPSDVIPIPQRPHLLRRSTSASSTSTITPNTSLPPSPASLAEVPSKRVPDISTFSDLFSNPLTYEEDVFGYMEDTSQTRRGRLQAYMGQEPMHAG